MAIGIPKFWQKKLEETQDHADWTNNVPVNITSSASTSGSSWVLNSSVGGYYTSSTASGFSQAPVILAVDHKKVAYWQEALGKPEDMGVGEMVATVELPSLGRKDKRAVVLVPDGHDLTIDPLYHAVGTSLKLEGQKFLVVDNWKELV